MKLPVPMVFCFGERIPFRFFIFFETGLQDEGNCANKQKIGRVFYNANAGDGSVRDSLCNPVWIVPQIMTNAF